MSLGAVNKKYPNSCKYLKITCSRGYKPYYGFCVGKSPAFPCEPTTCESPVQSRFQSALGVLLVISVRFGVEAWFGCCQPVLGVDPPLKVFSVPL